MRHRNALVKKPKRTRLTRRIVSRFIKNEKAQALAEFAILAPILVVMLGILISGGQMLYIQLAMQQAVYEGARAGITAGSLINAETASKTAVDKFTTGQLFIDHTQVNVTFPNPPASWARGTPYTVQVSYTANVLFPVPGFSNWTWGASHPITRSNTLSFES